MERNRLNNLSSREDKKSVADAVYENLADYFFDKIVFVNLAYSDLGGGGTTSTTNYGKLSRIIDTSKGLLMRAGRESRLRCQFYIKNPSKIEGYILSPVLYDSQSLPASLTDMSVFRSYVGIKIKNDVVYIAVKQAGEEEVLTPLDLTLTMFDATYTDTYTLEIKHNVLSTEIFINNQLYGSFSSNMIGPDSVDETFYSFFSPARSTDGTSVNIVSENIQFIQSKQ